MAKPETIRDYLTAVTEQIRWKRARPVLSRELERHLEDQKNDFLAAGQSPEEAEHLAVAEMGDPVTVGTELDRLHRPKAQWGLLLLAAALALTGGLLRVLLGTDDYSGSHVYMGADPLKTALALLLGTACMFGLYSLDYSRLIKHAGPVYLGTLVLSALLRYSDSTYYLRYLVLIYPIVYALWLFRCRGRGWTGFTLAVLGGVPLAVLVSLSHYLFGLFLLLIAGFIMLLRAIREDWFGISCKKATAATVLIAVCLGVPGLIRYGTSMWSRLYVSLHPEVDIYGEGYYVNAIQETLRQSSWLPTSPPADGPFMIWGPDLLLAEAARQLGRLSFLLLTAALCALCVWLAARCLRQKSQAGRMVALAVVLALGTQTVSALALNLGFCVISAHLPLLAGNLHTVLDMAMIGLALSVFRGDSIARDESVTRTVRTIRIPRVRISWE